MTACHSYDTNDTRELEYHKYRVLNFPLRAQFPRLSPFTSPCALEALKSVQDSGRPACANHRTGVLPKRGPGGGPCRSFNQGSAAAQQRSLYFPFPQEINKK